MKKGFTLIELLAVIVILAIILLIAVPMVTSVIEDAKKGAIEASAGMTMKAIENEHLRQKLKGDTGEMEVVIEDYVQTSTDKLELNGKNIKEGYIHINSVGAVSMVVTDGVTIIEKDPTQTELNTLAEDYESQDLLAMYTILKANGPSSFACGDVLTDSRDSNTYETVQIGTQCWLAEDLKYDCSLAGYNNTTTRSTPNWTGNNNCGNQGTDYDGIIYQWNVAVDGNDGLSGDPVQGLCPSGWHVPTHDEWTDLERTVCEDSGNSNCETVFPKNTITEGFRGSNEGQLLKSTTPTWNGATNQYDFNIKPAGSRSWNGALSNTGTYALYWTSSTSNTDAWRRNFSINNPAIDRYKSNQDYGSSVRCILDN